MDFDENEAQRWNQLRQPENGEEKEHRSGKKPNRAFSIHRRDVTISIPSANRIRTSELAGTGIACAWASTGRLEGGVLSARDFAKKELT